MLKGLSRHLPHPEDGDSKDLRTVDILPQSYTVLQTKNLNLNLQRRVSLKSVKLSNFCSLWEVYTNMKSF